MSNGRIWLLTALSIAAVAAAIRFSSVCILFVISAIFAYLLTPLTDLLARKSGMKRGFAVGIVFVGSICVLGLGFSWLLPPVAAEAAKFIQDLPSYARMLNETMENLLVYADEMEWSAGLVEFISQSTGKINEYITQFLVNGLSSILSQSTKLLDVVMVLILTFYLMLDGKKLVSGLMDSLPHRLKQKAKSMGRSCNNIMWKYLEVQLFVSVCTGLTAYIGLLILGVKYALFLGVITVVLNFIPYIGSIISGIVTIVVAFFSVSLTKTLVTAIFVLVLQQFWGNIVNPKLQADSTGMHPVVVIFSLLACNELWGPVGMFLAVPVAGIVRMILKEAFDYLFDRDSDREIQQKL